MVVTSSYVSGMFTAIPRLTRLGASNAASGGFAESLVTALWGYVQSTLVHDTNDMRSLSAGTAVGYDGV